MHDISQHTIKEREAAAYIGMSVAWLRQGRQRGRGPAFVQIDRAVRYRVADLDAWIAAHRIDPSAREQRAAGAPV